MKRSVGILIIDTGGTTWNYAYTGNPRSSWSKGQNSGYNAAYDSLDQLETNLKLTKSKLGHEIQMVRLYGAGITDRNKDSIHSRIKALFPEANDILVDSDIMGLAHSLTTDQSSWVGILGTGSNLHHWDGQQMDGGMPSFGYLLGDEGSGRSITKAILKKYYRGVFSSDLHKSLSKVFNLNYAELIEEIYGKGNWVTLASSYSDGLAPLWKHPEIESVVLEELDRFCDKMLSPALKIKADNILLSGGVAKAYKTYLRSRCTEITTGMVTIVDSPLEGIIKRITDEY